jgi:hypothetical protein
MEEELNRMRESIMERKEALQSMVACNVAESNARLLRQLAESVECITEDDLCLLADIAPSTAEAWRKRGKAPPYLILGNRPLYLRKGLQAFIEARARYGKEGEPHDAPEL